MNHANAWWFGENLYGTWNWQPYTAAQVKCATAVTAWYGEVNNYKFTDRPWTDNDFYSVGHFTQLVWKSTKAVGCGAALSSAGATCYVVVCRYGGTAIVNKTLV